MHILLLTIIFMMGLNQSSLLTGKTSVITYAQIMVVIVLLILITILKVGFLELMLSPKVFGVCVCGKGTENLMGLVSNDGIISLFERECNDPDFLLQ